MAAKKSKTKKAAPKRAVSRPAAAKKPKETATGRAAKKVAPRKLIEEIGVENVLVETDIPHPTCLYPGAREHFAEVLADLSPYALKRVLQDNAAELYNIPL